jgi:hypothetical protein
MTVSRKLIVTAFVLLSVSRLATGLDEKDRDHGWYPETQKAADELFAKVLRVP